tara:strand:- start:75 stop:260 length:186 start_codon:yes stop_codon:yes gene_type:complete
MSDFKKVNNGNNNEINEKWKDIIIKIKHKSINYYKKNELFYNSDGIGLEIQCNDSHILQKN